MRSALTITALVWLAIPSVDGAGEDYAPTAAKRATAALKAAEPLDADNEARARKAIEAHYLGLHALDRERDTTVKAAGGDKAQVDAARAKSAAAAKELRERFSAALIACLTAAQAEAVKDQMTYNVAKITLKAYRDMLPKLTPPQVERIRELLLAGREEALVAGSAEAKHAQFGIAKGRINNYLSAHGYDLRAAGKEWAERKKAGK